MFRDYCLWPPLWVDREGKSKSSTREEVGALLRVNHGLDDPRRIFLTMVHEAIEYTGCVLMEYHFPSTAMVNLLEKCIGMTTETIGDLEVPLALETTAHTPTRRERNAVVNVTLKKNLGLTV